MSTTQTTPVANIDALTQAVNAQREAAYTGLDGIMRIAQDGMNGYTDMPQPDLQNAFVVIYDAALSLGVTVQKIAETVGCEDYASIGFKPTEGADAQVQELQATVNEIDLHAKEAVGKMMGVSALAAIAVECAGTGRTGSNLWGTFQALHHLARDTSNLIEQLG